MIICEIGQNHLGNMGLAKDLIKLAHKNGGDLVKFQLYNHEALYGARPDIPDVALSFDQAKMLFNYGEQIGIEVFFSVFDIEKVRWCEEIGVKRYKIASMMNDDSVLNAVKATEKDIMESTQLVRRFIYPSEALYCPTGYPQTDIKFSNLNWADGFSDHTIGLNCAKIALARGASIIEKHFAIDHKTGVDAEWSMNPSELKELVRFENVCRQTL